MKKLIKNLTKLIVLILFFFFVSCKNETKTEKKSDLEEINGKGQEDKESTIDASVAEMWKDYVQSYPKIQDKEIPESDFFHNNREDANRLATLVLDGKKKAFSGLYSLYKAYNIELPTIGTKQIVTDFDGKAKAIIKNVSVDTIPYNDISETYAQLDMGTDKKPLEKWKQAHWDFFESFLMDIGKKPTQEMLVVCVRFEKIWPK